jgi:hypothetical protein
MTVKCDTSCGKVVESVEKTYVFAVSSKRINERSFNYMMR